MKLIIMKNRHGKKTFCDFYNAVTKKKCGRLIPPGAQAYKLCRGRYFCKTCGSRAEI